MYLNIIYDWICQHWDKIVDIATVLSPIIAVIIACQNSRATSKANAKLVKEIKQLSVLQLRTSMDMLEVDLCNRELDSVFDSDEMRLLRDEMNELKNKTDISDADLQKVMNRMSVLEKNNKFKYNIYLKISQMRANMYFAIKEIANN